MSVRERRGRHKPETLYPLNKSSSKQTLHPKTYTHKTVKTLSPKPDTLQSLNPKRQTLHPTPTPYTLNPEPKTLTVVRGRVLLPRGRHREEGYCKKIRREERVDVLRLQLLITTCFWVL